MLANATVITPKQSMCGNVLTKDGKIREVFPIEAVPENIDAHVIDCGGLYVGPGFVDIHVHGGMGNDFVSEDVESVAKGIDYHLLEGTTSIVPASISMPFTGIRRAIQNVENLSRTVDSTILGFHVEGVYLDKTYRGGHLIDYVHAPDPDEYLPLLEQYGGFISEWTLAPELDGALELIRKCAEYGIVTSVGHSQASYDVLMAAIDAGLSHSTHFACVMGNLRFEALGKSTGKGYAPGVLETVLLDDRLTTEVIADGNHLHKAIIQLAVKCKGVDGVCAVSDAMMGVGLPDGEYVIGGQECVVKDNLAIIKDRPDIIASSVTPMIGMFRFLVNGCGLSVDDAWTMTSSTPSKIIKANTTKGSLEKGKDADIVVLDQNLDIRHVFAKGKHITGHSV